MIIDKSTKINFIYDEKTPSGLKKIASKVAGDIRLVTGGEAGLAAEKSGGIDVIFGIAGITEFPESIDVSGVIGKREVYLFKPVPAENVIYIAGSDKRGTIYGLFHISDLLGVSPLVNWSNVVPVKKSLTLGADDEYLSKEPSVRYRGFFINDEWPCFGNWCMKHFGGFTAEMYEGVFELLLRMKGNYLWPAMWSSCFAEDGPGLKSAELADELGVVIGLSHHEPCLRHGEEYSHVRGKDSIYGDAWDFRSNREGIIRFWRDGLKRNGHLENVITIGMRGERDSKILGEDATLRDNIELLRDVIKTQNQLIKEEVNENIDEVPRMLALYKEVEPYYYGRGEVKGLRGSEDLDDVILLLCDDNHGYVRSLPDEEMRKHKGGFGMYYHFDYHGDPVSYEWINSTHLPEVWEQMTTAYEHGIRSLWIVNVGDLGLQETPLSYFLSLAYDYDKWGITNPNNTEDYLKSWFTQQFGGAFDEAGLERLCSMYVRYSRLVHNRRPEHLNDKVYHPQNYHEAELILKEAEEVASICEELYAKCPAENKDSFEELVSYNVLAGMNLIKLWIMRAYDHYFASIGAVVANDYADEIRKCLAKDDDLRDIFHSAADGKWDGFGLAEHIGFKHWNSEECAYPIIETVTPVRRPEIMVGLMGERAETSGQEWTKKVLKISNYPDADKDVLKTGFFIALTGDRKVPYRITTDSDEVKLSDTEGSVSLDKPMEVIEVSIGRKAFDKENKAHIYVTYELGRVEIELCPVTDSVYILDADEYSAEQSGSGEWLPVKDIGRRESGMKYLPVIEDKVPDDSAYLDYKFDVIRGGTYRILFQLLPTNPYTFGQRIRLSYSVNPGEAGETNGDKAEVKTVYVTSEEYEPGVTADWGQGVLDHVRMVEVRAELKGGENIVRFYATSRENVLERVILVEEGYDLPDSYLGPPSNKM
ncbi:MAG: glycosyl hydrolase 115 family protein [Eubacterium sp.]|nr:glycosyl hydrolase 115 family protein [Eubacterium sp.]